MRGEEDTHTRLSVQVLTLAALLLLVAWPESPGFVATLRGEERPEVSSDRARARGYYEGLLTIGDKQRGRVRQAEGTTLAPLPPGFVPFEDAGIVEDTPGYLHWKLRAGISLRWNGSTFRTNALGFRGAEIVFPKPAGTYRVVVLGSSNTLGQGVEDEDGYVRRLERWLAAKAGPGHRVEVVNLAVSGYAPTQRLHRLLHEVAPLEPNWVLWDTAALDVVLEELHLRWALHNQVPIPFEFVRSSLSRAGVSETDSPKEFGRKYLAVQTFLLEETLAQCAAGGHRLGVPVSVVLLPRFDSKDDQPTLYRWIQTTARSLGLDCLDLTAALDGQPLGSYQIGPWETHPNARGHELMFEALKREIERTGGAPGLTR